MHRDVAQRVLGHLEQANASLHEAYRELHDEARGDRTEPMRRIASIMGLLGEGLMKHLYVEHPDLCPEQLRFYLNPEAASRDHWPWPASDPGGWPHNSV